MLSDRVCLKCYREAVRGSGGVLDDSGGMGLAWVCLYSSSNRSVNRETAQPFPECPYKLEHAIAEAMEKNV
jgi:hypothetical protein